MSANILIFCSFVKIKRNVPIPSPSTTILTNLRAEKRIYWDSSLLLKRQLSSKSVSLLMAGFFTRIRGSDNLLIHSSIHQISQKQSLTFIWITKAFGAYAINAFFQLFQFACSRYCLFCSHIRLYYAAIIISTRNIHILKSRSISCSNSQLEFCTFS